MAFSIGAYIGPVHWWQQMAMQTLKAGVLYFGLVFWAAFVFEAIRTLYVVQRLGERMAELLEAPIMLVITIIAARWVVLHLAIPRVLSARLGMGGVALGLLLVAEFALVRLLRGMSFREYLDTRDPVSRMVYYVMLGICALMPLLVDRRY